jgi:hypothetical protein
VAAKEKQLSALFEVEMKGTSKFCLSAAFMAISALMPKPVMAAHICWIDQVNSTSSGITLKFRPDASLFGGVKYKDKKEIVQFTVEQGVAKITGKDRQQHSGAEVVLNVGDAMGIHQGVEDTCDVQVVVQGGRAGVLLRGVSTASPYGPSSSSEFVAAE